jgi:hypothetical protein
VTEPDRVVLGNALSGEDREQLIRLRWLWEKSYVINFDGALWTAVSLADPPVVLEEETSGGLWRSIREDNAQRKATGSRGGYWIERCSGPPYFVATPPA